MTMRRKLAFQAIVVAWEEKVKALIKSYLDKKYSFLCKIRWSDEKCPYFPTQKLDCSYFLSISRLAYFLEMFLLLKKK